MSKRPYDASQSATSKAIAFMDEPDAKIVDNVREHVKIAYGLGHITGDLASDKVCLGSEENVCVRTNLIEATEMSDEPFNLVPYDGILGLGLPKSSLNMHFNLMGNLAEAHQLQNNRFGVWLAKADDGEDSEITFGSWNGDRLGSTITWMPLSKKAFEGGKATGMWQAVLKDVFVDNVKLDECGEDGCEAAFDTGTAVLAGPTPIVTAARAQLAVKEDCSNYDQLKPLGFYFQDKVFNLDKEEYVRKTVNGCFLQFADIDIPPPKGPLLLLGHPFMKRYYTIFDREALMIGIAFSQHKKPSAKADETTDEAAQRLMVKI
jgi:hypothetical protein